MSLNYQSYYARNSLSEMLKNAVIFDTAGKKRIIKEWINHRLTDYKAHRYQSTYFRRDYLELKRRSQMLGGMIGQCIRDDDSETACSIVNETAFRTIRNRANFSQLFEKVFSHRHFYSCEDCGEIMDSEGDRISWVYDSNPVCTDCIDSDYTYYEPSDTYIRNEDYEERMAEEEENEEDDSIIGEYHSSNPCHIPSAYDNRKPKVLMGLELEIEVSERYAREEKAEDILNAIGTYRNEQTGSFYRYCQAERDGSLDYGFEIVTGYTGLDVHRKQLEYFKSSLSGLKSHNSSTCGLHIHVCKSTMSLYHGAKLILFINDEKNNELIKTIARRAESGYAKIKNKKDNIVWLKQARETRNPLNNLNNDRYEALNFQNPNTIEFRLFKGSLKYETIQACLEFSFLSWHFTKDASIKDLTSSKFLEFINKPENREDSIYLRQYLKEKGFSELFVPNKKTA